MDNHLPDANPASPLNVPFNRRGFLRRATLAGMTAAVAPAAASLLLNPSSALAATADETDAAVLNFALNLEYLEAEYYSYAVFGTGIESQGVGVDGVGTPGTTIVKSDSKVDFKNDIVASYAKEIAQDEINHVKFLRTALGDAAVARPEINLLDSFNGAAKAAGIADTFDPFGSDLGFLTGAFIFEDVGVTAYHGAAPLITDKTFLSAAAGILAVEAYHASEVRTVLYGMSQMADKPSDIIDLIQKISDLRDSLDGASGKDQGLVNAETGDANIVPTNGNSLAFARSTRKVLNIVYGATKVHKGLFFPNGMNGSIK